MKSKLYLPGLIIISIMIVSCSDDDYENHKVQNDNLKAIPIEALKSDLNEKEIDSVSIRASEIIAADGDGEPINPKPPRR